MIEELKFLWMMIRTGLLFKGIYEIHYLPADEDLGYRFAFTRRAAWRQICREAGEDPRNPTIFGPIENYRIVRR